MPIPRLARARGALRIARVLVLTYDGDDDAAAGVVAIEEHESDTETGLTL